MQLKRKRLLLVGGLIFILCGCTAKTDLVVTSDKTIIETTTLSLITSELGTTTESINQYFASIEEAYKDSFEGQNYHYKKWNKKDQTILSLTNTYSSFEEFMKSTSYRTLYTDATIIRDRINKTFYFKASGENMVNLLFQKRNEASLLFPVDRLEVKVQFHNKVIQTNADRVDTGTNTYTWVFDTENYEKYIEFRLSNHKRYDIMVKYYWDLYHWIILAVVGAILVLICFSWGLIRRFKTKDRI